MRDWMNWVSENEFHVHEKWFLNYLGQRHLFYLPLDYDELSSRDRISQISQGLENSHRHSAPLVELAIKRMKAAWAQKKRRMRSPGEKPYNFFMSTKIQKSLQLLAKKHGTSINRALEALILDQDAIVKAMEKQHREELKKAKAASSRKGAGIGSRVGYLRTTGNNDGQEASLPEQFQMSEKLITATTEGLERLISKMIDQRIGEVTASPKEPLNKAQVTEAQELSPFESPTPPVVERPPHKKPDEGSSLKDIRSHLAGAAPLDTASSTVPSTNVKPARTEEVSDLVQELANMVAKPGNRKQYPYEESGSTTSQADSDEGG